MIWNNKSEAIIQFLAVIIQLVLKTSCDHFVIRNIEKPILEDLLLCRGCGNDITSSQQLINTRISSHAEYAKNETLFNKSEVLVQSLQNPHGLSFKVILVHEAECTASASDTWTASSTWFKGFAWKSCHCPRCGTHLGWMFEPISGISETETSTKDGFYALIVSSIVDEHFVDSLLMREKIFRD